MATEEAGGPSRRDDDWNAQQRAEGPLQRADRSFAELLQELRVVLIGVQILFAFLLTLPFTARFDTLDGVQRGVFIATLAFAALSSTLLLAPVAAHRLLFQRGRKPELVLLGHRLALAGLGALALTLSSGLLLVVDVAAGRPAALVMSGALLVLSAVLWVVLPLRMRR